MSEYDWKGRWVRCIKTGDGMFGKVGEVYYVTESCGSDLILEEMCRERAGKGDWLIGVCSSRFELVET